MAAPAVRFVDVTKRYRRGGVSYRSLRQDLAGLGRRQKGREGETGVTALDRVSFEVGPGESFAIMGPNGAGKSTALRLVSRISSLTSGRLEVRGRVGALIEVGSGVHPELSGRENVWQYGAIMGMSRREVGQRFDEIVAFAELERAIDTPVKYYSTGMQLRLGFSIVAHLRPSVFVVDEALAVGDSRFQDRCVQRMRELLHEGTTLLFVSHNLIAIETVCERGMVLVEGNVRALGPVDQALRSYTDWLHDNRERELQPDPRDHRSGGALVLRRVAVRAVASDGTPLERGVRTGDDVDIELHVTALDTVRQPHVTLAIDDGRSGQLASCSMLRDGPVFEEIDGPTIIRCRLRNLPLLPRVYQLWCTIRGPDAVAQVLEWQAIGVLHVAEGPDVIGPAGHTYSRTGAPVRIEHDWLLG